MVSRKICPSGDRTDVALFSSLSGDVCFEGHPVERGGADYLRAKDVIVGQQQGILAFLFCNFPLQAGRDASTR